MNELLVGKLASIERCVKRIRETWEKPTGLPFEQDFDKQDIIMLNLQRAFETLLDIGNHLVRARKLGWPENSAATFTLLEQADIITLEMMAKLKAMAGMRNIIVHRYQDIDQAKVEQVVEHHLDELIEMAQTIISRAPGSIVTLDLPGNGNDLGGK